MSYVRVDGNTGDCFLIKSGVRQGCILAPDCFDVGMDWVLDHSTHQAMHDATLGSDAFKDFDYADDVALLSELPSLLLSALEIFAEEAAPIGLLSKGRKRKSSPSVTFCLRCWISVLRAGRSCNDIHLSQRLDQHIMWQPPWILQKAWYGQSCHAGSLLHTRVSCGTSNEGTTLLHPRQTHCSICLWDLDCYQVWQWEDWHVRPVVFEVHLWSLLVRSYNQHGDSVPHLSTTIEQSSLKALLDFIWSRGLNGAPSRHITRHAISARGCRNHGSGQRRVPLHMEINWGKEPDPS